MLRSIALLSLIALVAPLSAIAQQPEPRRIAIDYIPGAEEIKVPERFRLAPANYVCEIDPPENLTDQFVRCNVRFPSPVVTETIENNTVHMEYYLPKKPKLGEKAPAVIVLHILGGDFPLARSFCHVLASRGVPALFLKMPYYGERRPKGSTKRMVSHDPNETVENFTQAVLDIRRAVDFLSRRDEVDPERIGIFGISLGGITGGLAAGVEPRLQNVCLLLAGGDLGRVAWESKEVERVRRYWIEQGKTKEDFVEALRPVDPLTYAESLRGRRVLLLNAKNDEVIPPECTKAFWKAAGEPEIVWYSGGHYTVAGHLFNAMQRVSDFFAKP